MTQCDKRVLELRKNHRWKARPGHKIFVADKGAVRFEFPENWIVDPQPNSTRFYDGQPPDDNCRLEVSVIYLPPLDWSSLPLSQLLEKSIKGDDRGIISREPVYQMQRPSLELAWTELAFIDPNEQRLAYSRFCLGRGANTHSLITMDFWAEDAVRLHSVWDGVLSTLELGRYVDDPTRGPSD